MAPDLSHQTIRMMHPTVGLETLQSLPIPHMNDFDQLQEQHTRERDIFCTVYGALLDDVQSLDRRLESNFSREIIWTVCNYATAFGIGNQDIPELQRFSQRLQSLRHMSQQTAAVQGVSGGTVLDYLVSLITEKSQPRGVNLSSLSNWQYQFARLKLTKVIQEIIKVDKEDKEGAAKKPSSKKVRAKDLRYEDEGDEKESKEIESRKEVLREIGLPSVLFICIGPHKYKQAKRKDQGEEAEHQGLEDHKDKDHDGHVKVQWQVVASSGETFSDVRLKKWAEKMHNERMRSVSLQGYRQVCAIEHAFFRTPAPGPRDGSSEGEQEKVRRANIIPHWQTLHHWPNASSSTTGYGPETEARIGVFDHSCETAAAFNVHSGFKRRARCFKCQSIYLYHQDLDSIRAEADMNGCHRTELTYDWTVGQRDDWDDETSSGPTCAETLGHLLCSEIM